MIAVCCPRCGNRLSVLPDGRGRPNVKHLECPKKAGSVPRYERVMA